MPLTRIKFTGMDNLNPDYSIPAGKARNIVNCDINNQGNLLIPRPGSSRVYLGTDCHSWYEFEHSRGFGFFIEGNYLKRLNSDATVTTLKEVGPDPMSFCNIGDTVYFSNIRTCGRYIDGTIYNWGVDTPLLQPVAELNQTGGMYEGDYFIAITWMSNGEESGALNSRLVHVTEGAGIRLSQFPTPPDYVDTVAVYCSNVNGADLYYYDEYPAHTTGEVFIRYFTGALKLDHQFGRKVTPGLGLTVHNGRIYWRDGTMVRYTDVHRYGTQSAFAYIPFEEVVTNIISLPTVLFVSTRKAIYRIDGFDTDQMSLTPVKLYGVAMNAVKYDTVDKKAYAFSDRGFIELSTEGIAELHSDSVVPPTFMEGTVAIVSQNGFRKLVFVGKQGEVSELQHPSYTASEVARKGNGL